MLKKIFTKIFGSNNDRILRNIQKTVNIINKMETEFEKLTNFELQNKTLYFKEQLQNNFSLENILPEAFATVRETSKRIFGMRHFDVQLIGGIVLNNNCVAEMKTGEGKTLTSTLPAYLNALNGKGVHIVTVNDYLAQRDAINNKKLFEFLGLTVGINISSMSSKEKKKAYKADITYGTNNEYGFDFLKDNMVFNYTDKMQRGLQYAIIDEVDSILIDESRTPLIISGAAEDSSKLYTKINKIIPKLIYQSQEDSNSFQGKGHFFIDEKSRQAYLTEKGLIFLEKLLIEKKIINQNESLYSGNNIIILHHIISALRAHKLFKKNVDYILKNNKIIIVDEHTGRLMEGRRWSEGLHQAIEAKENVKINNENQTLASITFQNYFRLYNKLSGMTGTAITESYEFKEIYKLDTIVIPTNKPMIRKDLPDLIYLTKKEKIKAIIKDIKKKNLKGQPILVGTISIKKSELISQKLKKIGIKHNVLNAKFHAREAEIISKAGMKYAVTIATNMAGRGTDIVLGGNFILNKKDNLDKLKKLKEQWQIKHEEIIKLGGLYVIGTERHESRRIDNQLRGRSGRQGDPGVSRFYLSMEDSLMRIFAPKNMLFLMQKLGMKNNDFIEHPWITKAISKAQKKVENYNFAIRKQLLEYDDVINDQRLSIYAQRDKLLKLLKTEQIIKNFRIDIFTKIINTYIQSDNYIKEKWNLKKIQIYFSNVFNLKLPIKNWINIYLEKNKKKINKTFFLKKIINFSEKEYFKKINNLKIKNIKIFEKNIILKILDNLWKEHLAAIEYLKQGIHLRGYAQQDPKQEYKKESFNMFNIMLNTLKKEVIIILSKLEKEIIINYDESSDILIENTKIINNTKNNNFMIIKKKSDVSSLNEKDKYLNNINFFKKKIGRNEKCPCLSGKKYKFCHGLIIK
ncbi:preprotein translocase subunit SecA [Enterobacteriaceae endosymbiont of Donacia bicoloricornis]|uniref:preprotein translocase subunit SecA n=1 Tax=Enterobacteriaceae endosymbiont of Donacia bicoloricornis TaxID=2675772 RepID=UPI001449BDAD|nr:preprotein translocase subunit SecA [Enterobacteriaceae endosymbiont of Donacia bicoloricornis]QJC37681.1 preprotein translocase subunit SecA [Enterobacteriaceae endosymbiont of Donacia bicoloricornis]